MKELFWEIASQIAAGDISRQAGTDKALAELKIDQEVWIEIVKELPGIEKDKDLAFACADLLRSLSQEMGDECLMQEAHFWIGWAAVLDSELGEAKEYFKNYSNECNRKEDWKNLCQAHISYGDAYSTIGRFSKALEHYEESFSFAEKIEQKGKYAEIWSKNAQVKKKLGQLDEALENYNRAISCAQSQEDEATVLQMMQALAEFFEDREDSDPNELFIWEKIAQFFEKIKNPQGQARSLVQMAKLIAEKNYHEKAIECLKKAIECLESEENTDEKSEMWNLLGKIYQEEGNFLEAIQCFEKARTILRLAQEMQTTPSQEMPVETTEKTQEWKPEIVAEDEEEIESYKKLLHEARIENDTYQECSVLHMMGNAYFGLGKLEQALKYWNDSLEIAQKRKDHESIYQNYYRLGLLSIKRGDLESARQSFQKGIEILEEMRYYVSMSIDFIQSHVEIFHQMIRCCVRMGNLASALHFVEQMHSWMFLGRVPERFLLMRSSVSEDIKNEYQTNSSKLQRIYQSVYQKTEKQSQEGIDIAWQSMNEYKSRLEELQTQIEVLDPEWSMLFGRRFGFDPIELQKNLSEASMLLEIIPTSESTFIFAVDSKQIRAIVLEEFNGKKLDELCKPFEQLEEYLRLWQDWCIEHKLGTLETEKPLLKKLQNFPWKNIQELHQEWQVHLDMVTRKLGELILPQLIPMLEENCADNIILIPAHRLSLLPLHLMIIPEQSKPIYILDRYQVIYSPNANLFLECKKRKHNLSNQLLLLGHAGHNLLFFKQEIQRLSKIWPGDTEMLSKKDASAENFCEKGASASHIHMGVHATSCYPDSLNSCLYLALENGGHSRFRAPNILAQINLQAEVVTLAANDSEIKFSSTGKHLGLPESLLYAGARSVVYSLWPMPDIACFLLMETFYHGLGQGLRPAMALYEAQNELREMTISQICVRLEQQQKLLPESKAIWLKRLSSWLSGDIERMSKDEQIISARMLQSYREPFLAKVNHSNDLDFSDFFKNPNQKSLLLEKYTDKEKRPFAHPIYWGNFCCSGMGLTEFVEREENGELSAAVYIEEIGFTNDEEATARDIEEALSSLTDEGVKSCETVATSVRENPILQKSQSELKAEGTYRVKTRCPKCGEKIRCITSDVGGKAKCPHCKQKIRIPPKPSPFDDIRIPALCPQCGESIHCFLPMAGRRAKCPRCHQKVRIPKRDILLAEIASSDIHSRIVLLNE